MMHVVLVMVLGMIAVCLFIFSMRDTVKRGYEEYEDRALDQIKQGLSDNLLFVDPKKLFFATLLFSLVIGIFLFAAYGLVVAGIGVFFCAFLPQFVLAHLKKKRDEKFVYQLPDCLSTLSMSLRAGANLARAMELVVEQQPPPISQEFAIVLSDVKMGQSIEKALERMYARVDSIEVELFTSAVSISRSVGGNLAYTMETLADTIRERLQIEGKIRALTSMGKAQGWVVGGMPLFVVYAMYKAEPDAMASLTNEFWGYVVCAVLAVMGLLAFFMIRKIIDIDV